MFSYCCNRVLQQRYKTVIGLLQISDKMNKKGVKIQGLGVKYDELEVFQNLNLSISPGKITSILGPNGCGKSTLMKVIIGLLPYDGVIQKESAPELVTQDPSHLLLPWLTNAENITFPQHESNVDQKILTEILSLTRLEDWKNKYPYQLSGGMAQLLLLSRALFNHSKILLLDEPFKSLDASISEKMLLALRRLHQKYRPTIVLVSHDINESLFLSDKMIILGKTKPTKIIKEIEIPFQERDHSLLQTVQFQQLRNEVLHEL